MDKIQSSSFEFIEIKLKHTAIGRRRTMALDLAASEKVPVLAKLKPSGPPKTLCRDLPKRSVPNAQLSYCRMCSLTVECVLLL